MLQVQELSVFVDTKQLLSNLSFTIKPGTLHVFMGPNGSGKSSLAFSLMGHPRYQISQGSIIFYEQDITKLSVDKRAKAGIFLSLQQPYEIPGLVLSTFLRESFRALYPQVSFDEYLDRLSFGCSLLGIDNLFLQRPLYEGFSGGEKKRCEMLQLLLFRPKLALLDELDSGLDIDSLKAVARGLQEFKKLCPEASLCIITHYQHILEYVTPDAVHVMKDGMLVQSGNAELIAKIQKYGYGSF